MSDIGDLHIKTTADNTQAVTATTILRQSLYQLTTQIASYSAAVHKASNVQKTLDDITRRSSANLKIFESRQLAVSEATNIAAKTAKIAEVNYKNLNIAIGKLNTSNPVLLKNLQAQATHFKAVANSSNSLASALKKNNLEQWAYRSRQALSQANLSFYRFAAATIPLVRGLRTAFFSFADLESQSARVTKLMIDNFAGVGRSLEDQIALSKEFTTALSKDLDKITAKYGTSRVLLQGIAGDFAELGVQTQEGLAGLVELTSAVEKLGNVDIAQSQKFVESVLQNILRIKREQGFDVDLSNIEFMNNVIKELTGQLAEFNLVENKTTLALKDIADAFPEVSAAATTFGLSMTETMAVLAPMVAAGFQVGASANSIKVSLQRMVAMTKQNTQIIGELNKALGDDFEYASGVGIKNIQMLTDSFNSLLKLKGEQGTLELFARLFGVRQGPRMETAIRQLAQFQEALSTIGTVEQEIASTLERSINKRLQIRGQEQIAVRNLIDISDVNTKANKEMYGQLTLEAKLYQEAQEEAFNTLTNKYGDFLGKVQTESGKIFLSTGFRNADIAGKQFEQELKLQLETTIVQFRILKETMLEIGRVFVTALKPLIDFLIPIVKNVAKFFREMSEGTKRALSFAAIITLLIPGFKLLSTAVKFFVISSTVGFQRLISNITGVGAKLITVEDLFKRGAKAIQGYRKAIQVSDNSIMLEGRSRFAKTDISGLSVPLQERLMQEKRGFGRINVDTINKLLKGKQNLPATEMMTRMLSTIPFNLGDEIENSTVKAVSAIGDASAEATVDMASAIETAFQNTQFFKNTFYGNTFTGGQAPGVSGTPGSPGVDGSPARPSGGPKPPSAGGGGRVPWWANQPRVIPAVDPLIESSRPATSRPVVESKRGFGGIFESIKNALFGLGKAAESSAAVAANAAKRATTYQLPTMPRGSEIPVKSLTPVSVRKRVLESTGAALIDTASKTADAVTLTLKEMLDIYTELGYEIPEELVHFKNIEKTWYVSSAKTKQTVLNKIKNKILAQEGAINKLVSDVLAGQGVDIGSVDKKSQRYIDIRRSAIRTLQEGAEGLPPMNVTYPFAEFFPQFTDITEGSGEGRKVIGRKLSGLQIQSPYTFFGKAANKLVPVLTDFNRMFGEVFTEMLAMHVKFAKPEEIARLLGIFDKASVPRAVGSVVSRIQSILGRLDADMFERINGYFTETQKMLAEQFDPQQSILRRGFFRNLPSMGRPFGRITDFLGESVFPPEGVIEDDLRSSYRYRKSVPMTRTSIVKAAEKLNQLKIEFEDALGSYKDLDQKLKAITPEQVSKLSISEKARYIEMQKRRQGLFNQLDVLKKKFIHALTTDPEADIYRAAARETRSKLKSHIDLLKAEGLLEERMLASRSERDIINDSVEELRRRHLARTGKKMPGAMIKRARQLLPSALGFSQTQIIPASSIGRELYDRTRNVLETIIPASIGLPGLEAGPDSVATQAISSGLSKQGTASGRIALNRAIKDQISKLVSLASGGNIFGIFGMDEILKTIDTSEVFKILSSSTDEVAIEKILQSKNKGIKKILEIYYNRIFKEGLTPISVKGGWVQELMQITKATTPEDALKSEQAKVTGRQVSAKKLLGKFRSAAAESKLRVLKELLLENSYQNIINSNSKRIQDLLEQEIARIKALPPESVTALRESLSIKERNISIRDLAARNIAERTLRFDAFNPASELYDPSAEGRLLSNKKVVRTVGRKLLTMGSEGKFLFSSLTDMIDEATPKMVAARQMLADGYRNTIENIKRLTSSFKRLGGRQRIPIMPPSIGDTTETLMPRAAKIPFVRTDIPANLSRAAAEVMAQLPELDKVVAEKIADSQVNIRSTMEKLRDEAKKVKLRSYIARLKTALPKEIPAGLSRAAAEIAAQLPDLNQEVVQKIVDNKVNLQRALDDAKEEMKRVKLRNYVERIKRNLSTTTITTERYLAEFAAMFGAHPDVPGVPPTPPPPPPYTKASADGEYIARQESLRQRKLFKKFHMRFPRGIGGGSIEAGIQQLMKTATNVGEVVDEYLNQLFATIPANAPKELKEVFERATRAVATNMPVGAAALDKLNLRAIPITPENTAAVQRALLGMYENIQASIKDLLIDNVKINQKAYSRVISEFTTSKGVFKKLTLSELKNAAQRLFEGESAGLLTKTLKGNSNNLLKAISGMIADAIQAGAYTVDAVRGNLTKAAEAAKLTVDIAKTEPERFILQTREEASKQAKENAKKVIRTVKPAADASLPVLVDKAALPKDLDVRTAKIDDIKKIFGPEIAKKVQDLKNIDIELNNAIKQAEEDIKVHTKNVETSTNKYQKRTWSNALKNAKSALKKQTAELVKTVGALNSIQDQVNKALNTATTVVTTQPTTATPPVTPAATPAATPPATTPVTTPVTPPVTTPVTPPVTTPVTVDIKDVDVRKSKLPDLKKVFSKTAFIQLKKLKELSSSLTKEIIDIQKKLLDYQKNVSISRAPGKAFWEDMVKKYKLILDEKIQSLKNVNEKLDEMQNAANEKIKKQRDQAEKKAKDAAKKATTPPPAAAAPAGTPPGAPAGAPAGTTPRVPSAPAAPTLGPATNPIVDSQNKTTDAVNNQTKKIIDLNKSLANIFKGPNLFQGPNIFESPIVSGQDYDIRVVGKEKVAGGVDDIISREDPRYIAAQKKKLEEKLEELKNRYKQRTNMPMPEARVQRAREIIGLDALDKEIKSIQKRVPLITRALIQARSATANLARSFVQLNAVQSLITKMQALPAPIRFAGRMAGGTAKAFFNLNKAMLGVVAAEGKLFVSSLARSKSIQAMLFVLTAGFSTLGKVAWLSVGKLRAFSMSAGIMSGIQAAITSLFQSITKTILSVTALALKVAAIGFIFVPLIIAVVSFVKALKGGISNLETPINNFKLAWQNIKEAIANIARPFKDLILAFAGIRGMESDASKTAGVLLVISNVVLKISEAFKKATAKGGAINNFIGQMRGIRDLKNTGVLIPLLTRAINRFILIWDALSGAISGNSKKAKEAITGLLYSVGYDLLGLIQIILQGLGKMTPAYVKMWQFIASAIVKAFEIAVVSVLYLMDILIGKIKEKIGGVFGNLISQAAKSGLLGAGGGAISDLVGGLLGFMKKGAAESTPKTIDAFVAVAKKSSQAVRDFINKESMATSFANFFKNIFDSAASGIGGLRNKVAIQYELLFGKNISVPLRQRMAKIGEISILELLKKAAVKAKAGGEQLGGNLANAVKKGLQQLKEDFGSAVFSNADAVVDRFIDNMKSSLELQRDKALEAFDQQVDAIQELADAEERLTEKIEYEERRRELIRDRALDRENYLRERRVAVYEGRVEDVRELDLSFRRSDKDSEKEIADLDKDRTRQLQSQQREIAISVINRQKEELVKQYDLMFKEFELRLDRIKSRGFSTKEEFADLLRDLGNAGTEFSGNLGTTFETAMLALPNAIAAVTDRSIGMFSIPLAALVAEAKAKFGATIGTANADSILGAAYALVTGMPEAFRQAFSIGIIAQYVTPWKDGVKAEIAKIIPSDEWTLAGVKAVVELMNNMKREIRSKSGEIWEEFKKIFADLKTNIPGLEDFLPKPTDPGMDPFEWAKRKVAEFMGALEELKAKVTAVDELINSMGQDPEQPPGGTPGPSPKNFVTKADPYGGKVFDPSALPKPFKYDAKTKQIYYVMTEQIAELKGIDTKKTAIVGRRINLTKDEIMNEFPELKGVTPFDPAFNPLPTAAGGGNRFLRMFPSDVEFKALGEKAGEAFVDGAHDGASNQIELSKSTFQLIGDKIKNAIVESGKLLNFWDGWLKPAFDNMWNSILDFFGIKSPSKKFHDLGINLIQGLINGIKSLIAEPGELIQTALSGVKTKIEEIGTSVSTTWSTNISPKLTEFRNYIANNLNTAIDTAKNKWGELSDGFKSNYETKILPTFDRIKNYLTGNQGLSSWLDKVKEGFETAPDAFKGGWNKFVEKWNLEVVGNLVKQLGSRAKEALGFVAAKLNPFYLGGSVGTFTGSGMTPGFPQQGVPALLHGGEYVINHKAVEKFGKGNLEQINNLRHGGYFNGGYIKGGAVPSKGGVKPKPQTIGLTADRMEKIIGKQVPNIPVDREAVGEYLKSVSIPKVVTPPKDNRNIFQKAAGVVSSVGTKVLDAASSIGAQGGLIDKLTLTAVTRPDKFITEPAKFLYREATKYGESINASLINPWINLGGKAIGKNPNLREAGPMEAVTTTASLALDILTAGSSSALRLSAKSATLKAFDDMVAAGSAKAIAKATKPSLINRATTPIKGFVNKFIEDSVELKNKGFWGIRNDLTNPYYAKDLENVVKVRNEKGILENIVTKKPSDGIKQPGAIFTTSLKQNIFNKPMELFLKGMEKIKIVPEGYAETYITRGRSNPYSGASGVGTREKTGLLDKISRFDNILRRTHQDRTVIPNLKKESLDTLQDLMPRRPFKNVDVGDPGAPLIRKIYEDNEEFLAWEKKYGELFNEAKYAPGPFTKMVDVLHNLNPLNLLPSRRIGVHFGGAETLKVGDNLVGGMPRVGPIDTLMNYLYYYLRGAPKELAEKSKFFQAYAFGDMGGVSNQYHYVVKAVGRILRDTNIPASAARRGRAAEILEILPSNATVEQIEKAIARHRFENKLSEKIKGFFVNLFKAKNKNITPEFKEFKIEDLIPKGLLELTTGSKSAVPALIDQPFKINTNPVYSRRGVVEFGYSASENKVKKIRVFVHDILGEKVGFGIDNDLLKQIPELKDVKRIPLNPFDIAGVEKNSKGASDLAKGWMEAHVAYGARGGDINDTYVSALFYAAMRRNNLKAQLEYINLMLEGRAIRFKKGLEHGGVIKKAIEDMHPSTLRGVKEKGLDFDKLIATHETDYPINIDEFGNAIIRPTSDFRRIFSGSEKYGWGPEVFRDTVHFALNHIVGGIIERPGASVRTGKTIMIKLRDLIEANPNAIENIMGVDTYFTPKPGEGLLFPAGKFEIIKYSDYISPDFPYLPARDEAFTEKFARLLGLDMSDFTPGKNLDEELLTNWRTIVHKAKLIPRSDGHGLDNDIEHMSLLSSIQSFLESAGYQVRLGRHFDDIISTTSPFNALTKGHGTGITLESLVEASHLMSPNAAARILARDPFKQEELVDYMTPSLEKRLSLIWEKLMSMPKFKKSIPRYKQGGYLNANVNTAIPSILHGGEYVLNAQAVKKIGVPTLEKLNQAKFYVPNISSMTMPSTNIQGGGSVSTSTQNVNIYVDNFIGEPEWFNSMMKEYNMKVLPKNQKAAGLETRVVKTYTGLNRGM